MPIPPTRPASWRCRSTPTSWARRIGSNISARSSSTSARSKTSCSGPASRFSTGSSAPDRRHLETSVRNPEPVTDAASGADTGARLMLVVLCCVWGVTWPIMRIALNEVTPFTMRTFSTLVGGLALFAVCLLRRSNLRLPGAKAWTHVVVSSLLNVASFSVFSTFAQLGAATSRVAILAYTMPIWAVVLAWLCLGERPTGTQPIALGLCIAGLAVLIYPLTAGGGSLGIVFALATPGGGAGGAVHLEG